MMRSIVPNGQNKMYDLVSAISFLHNNNNKITRNNVLKTAQFVVDKCYDQLISKLSASGWVTSHVLLGTGEWRYSWTHDKNT